MIVPSMRMIRVILFLFITVPSFSQTLKSFSTEPDKFLDELHSFLIEGNQEEGEVLMAELRAIWITGGTLNEKEQEKMYKEANKIRDARMKGFPEVVYVPYGMSSRKLSDKQKTDVIRTANAMLKKRMKPLPDYKNYITALLSFINGEQSEESFSNWQSSLDKLLQGPNKYFSSFINTCITLFMTNAPYYSVSTKWKAGSKNYSFGFDSVPKIIFPEMDLTCYAKGDSSIIRKTKGVYYPDKETWRGEGGIVNWNRAGLDENACRAELRKYTIIMNGSDYTADSVTFYNTQFFKEPLLGALNDKLLANTTKENASYPRFESYNVKLKIDNLITGVNYVGGFSRHGNKMIGSGNKEEDAHLLFYRDKKLFLDASSNGFVVRPDKITSDKTAVVFYFEQDSIYHPSLDFKLIIKERELALIRSPEGVGNSPFFNSFHKIDMHFDALYWKIDNPIIEYKMISGIGESKATFESANFYKQERFSKQQGLSDTHPFIIIKRFCDKYETREVYAEDLAKFMGYSVNQIRLMLIDFANQGFVIFDMPNNRAYVKDRLFYYLQAKVGKTDYDVIRFQSVSSGKSNATLNLLNWDLRMSGVERIFLSDSQNVFIDAANDTILLKKNRDFNFSGRVHAGRFDFYGKEFLFNYDKFKIDLNNVDSLTLKVPDPKAEPDALGRRPLILVKSVLENITGDLLIDHPTNKSGLVDQPGYPIFNSKKDSYVFYDRKFIFGGVYSKDKVFFHLEPFTIDSLDNFTAEGLSFKGTFASGGVFPEFKEMLTLQSDYSLGFIRQTPENGFPNYGGKGTYFSTIKMSNNGLRGDGTLNFITSTTKSNDFLYFPDSMNTTAQSFEIKKETVRGVEYPAVKAENVYIHWMPYKDRMFIHRKETDLDFYEGKAKMAAGSVELTPQELVGIGLMKFNEAELESKLIHYKLNSFNSDTADFRLSSDNTSALAFKTNNVKADIDFVTNTGVFKANGAGSFVSFPVNQYICFIDQFKWFMGQKEIELSASSNSPAASALDLEGSEFISTHPDQDSLRFFAPFAKYSLKDYLIQARKVKRVDVADAQIFPDSGVVVIEKKAKMRTLNNAMIIANATTKYHTIFNATVNVYARKNYEAEGDYNYVDAAKIKHQIHFTRISVDTTIQTVAYGEIADTTFTLSPQVQYKGSAHLKAASQNLAFKGSARLNLNCPLMTRTWFRIDADINPEEIEIPVTLEPKEEGGGKLSNAVLLTTGDSARVYTSFFSDKVRSTDNEISTAEGILVYDKGTNEYRISTKEKLLNNKLPGNYLSFADGRCASYGEGTIVLAPELGGFKMTAVGNVNNDMNADTTYFDLMMTFDFFFSDDALKIMTENLQTMTTLPPTVDQNRVVFEKGVFQLLGKEKADKLIAEINLYGSPKKIPSELQHTMFLSDVKMAWNKNTKSYISSGPIGLFSMDKNKIGKMVNGTIEVIRKRSGDVINLYLEGDESNWYFFSYTRGVMIAISSNTAYNELLKELKPDKRQIKADKDQPGFVFQLGTLAAKEKFLKRIKNPTDE